MRLRLLLAGLALGLGWLVRLPSVPAQEPPSRLAPVPAESVAAPVESWHGPVAGVSAGEDSGLYFKDQWTVQFLSGAYFAPCGIGPTSPTFDFLTEQIRLGWMHNDPCGPGLLRGTVETLLDVTVAPVVDGFGDIVVGPSLMLRYNFVQPGCDLAPYVQGGAGIVYTDAYRDREQRAIGEAVEFFLQVGIGAHYRIADSWTLDAEGELIHISNAGLASRNHGINALGASLGVTYFLH